MGDDNGTSSVASRLTTLQSDSPETQTRKIAVLGKAPSTVQLAPFDDPSWEIWILNTLGSNNEIPRWDRQYELHELELTKAKAYGNYYDWLRQQSHGERSIFLRDDPPKEFGSAAAAYPLDAIRKTFAHLPRLYLTNSISLMLCHALFESIHGDVKISHVGAWGVDMAQHAMANGHASWFTSEYARQRPSVEYWFGLLAGHGINLFIPAASDVLRSPCIYGHHHTEGFKKMQARRQELQQRINNAQAIEQQKHDEAAYLSGALESTLYEMQSNLYPEK